MDALNLLMRRRLPILIGVVCILGASLAALKIVPTNYEASGQVLLLPPAEPVLEGSRVNPYLNLPQGLVFTAGLLASTVSTPDAQREMAADGFSTGYSVSVAPGTGPLIVITVENTDPAAALATRNELITRLNEELDAIQVKEAVPDTQIIVARQFSVSARAEVLAGSKIKAIAVILALGIVLTAIAVFAIDRMDRAHPADRENEPDDEHEPDGEPEHTEPEPERREAQRRVAERPAPERRVTERPAGGHPVPGTEPGHDDQTSTPQKGTPQKNRTRERAAPARR
jgi:capsular polysaccharide biosynthesis protein